MLALLPFGHLLMCLLVFVLVLVDMDTRNHGSICGCPVDDDSILILSNFQVVLTWKDMCAWKEGSLWCLKWSQGVPLVS